MTDAPGKTFHSFRHKFVAMLRSAGVDRDVIKALVGHRNNDVTAGYGRVEGALFPVQVLNEALQKVNVNGLDLTHLHRPCSEEPACSAVTTELEACLTLSIGVER